MRLRSVLLTLALLGCASFAFAETPSADSVMSGAFAKAKAEHKTVFLSFHASWCGWCHKFEDFLKRPEIAKIWDKRFVMVWLTVMENGDKKSDENPGGMDWLKKTGGENGGIPFMALYSADGNMKITSNRPGTKGNGNIGYPAATEEISWFMTMLEKGAPNMTASERATVKKSLEEVAKTIKH